MILLKIKKRINRFLNRYACFRLKTINNGELWSFLDAYRQKSHFSGTYYYKYLKLYQLISRHKFKEILECGSGVSTIIIAFALRHNGSGRVTSMEQHSGEYFQRLLDIFPREPESFVEFKTSSIFLDHYGFLRGVRYSEVPERPYDFVFIDGPSTASPTDGEPTFDFDFISVIRRPLMGKMRALIDNRKSTEWALRQIFGESNVKYHSTSSLGYVKAVDKSDMRGMKDMVNFY